MTFEEREQAVAEANLIARRIARALQNLGDVAQSERPWSLRLTQYVLDYEQELQDREAEIIELREALGEWAA